MKLLDGQGILGHLHGCEQLEGRDNSERLRTRFEIRARFSDARAGTRFRSDANEKSEVFREAGGMSCYTTVHVGLHVRSRGGGYQSRCIQVFETGHTGPMF